MRVLTAKSDFDLTLVPRPPKLCAPTQIHKKEVGAMYDGTCLYPQHLGGR